MVSSSSQAIDTCRLNSNMTLETGLPLFVAIFSIPVQYNPKYRPILQNPSAARAGNMT